MPDQSLPNRYDVSRKPVTKTKKSQASPAGITPDEFQNFLLLIEHHAMDALEADNQAVVESSLYDILEIVDKMKKYLPGNLSKNLDVAEQIARYLE